MNTNNKYCLRCGLHKNVEHAMLTGRGAESPDILVIATHPIIASAKTGEMWNSNAEAAIKKEFDLLGASVFYTHALKCTPFKIKGDKKVVEKPTVTQVTMCNTFTVKLIQELRPKVVLCIGAVAMKQIMGFHIPIGGALDKVFYHPELDVNVLITWDTIKILDEDTIYKEQMKKSVEFAVQVSKRPKQRKITTEPKHLSDHYDIQAYLNKLLTVEMFAFDLETTGLNAFKDRITDVSLCCEIGKGVHILWSDIQEHIVLFQQVMSSSVKKMGHNVAFDVLFLKTHGVPTNNVFFDTMLAAHTLYMSAEGAESRSLFGLKAMTWHMTTEGGYEEILEGGIVKAQQKRLAKPKEIEEQASLFTEEEMYQSPKDAGQDLVDLELDGYATYVYNKRMARVKSYGLEPIYYYAAMDSDVTLRIYYKLRYEINTQYDWLFNQLIMPLNTVLTKMSFHGCLLDVEYMDSVKAKNMITMEEVKKNVFAAVGYEFNIDSSEQLSELMYKTMKLTPDKNFMTDGGKLSKPKPSVDEDALLHYADEQPILRDILKYKKCGKQNSTYIEGFKTLVDDHNRIHPSFGQSTTATGRLSASSPNLQNIPRDNVIRNMIVAPPGHQIVSADLSQAELRILAMLSNDQAMIAAFASGQDFHTLTACNMFGIPLDTFDKHINEHAEARTAAKCVAYNTRIPTEYGLMPIRILIADVPEVDNFKTFDAPVKVVNPDGNYTDATQYYEGGEVIGNVIILENGMMLEGSDDHKIQVLSNDCIIDKNLSSIVEGDLVLCQGGLPDVLHANPTIPSVAKEFSLSLESASQLATFMWIFGTVHNNSVKLEFHDNIHAYDACTDILRASSGIFYVMSTQTLSDRNIYIKNEALVEMYTLYFTLNDSVPEIMWQTNKTMAKEFISTLFTTKGIKKKGCYTLSGHLRFLLDLQQMLFMWFGILSTIKDETLLVWYNTQHSFISELDTLSVDRLALHDIKGNKSFTLHKVNEYLSYAAIPVIGKAKSKMMVADLFVPEGNKFNSAGIISSNCINFGVVYQQGAKALAFGLKNDYGIEITEEQAQNFINKFYRAYPGVATWMEDIKDFVSKNGYIETLYGRRRYLPLVRSSLRWVRESAYRRAINCVDAETEALSKRGWLKYSDITLEDILLTKNKDTNKLEWQQVTNISVFPDYEGPVYEFESRSFSAVTTPHHRWLVSCSKKEGNFEKLSENLDMYGHDKIHRTGIYDYTEEVYSDDFVELAGWVLTDGHYLKDRTNAITISQSLRAKPKYVAEIDALITRLNLPYGRHVTDWSQCVVWRLSYDFGKKFREQFPDRKLSMNFITKLSTRQAQLLMKTMLKADGHTEKQKGNTKGKISFYTPHEDVAGIFQILCTMCGYASVYKWTDQSMYEHKSPKLHPNQKSFFSKGVWTVTILYRKTAQVVMPQRIISNKKILMWCPTVPNTFFVARRRHNTYITGNTPVQSLASDVACLGLIRVDKYIEENKIPANVFSIVHDDILIDVEDSYVDQVSKKLVECMTSDLPKLTIPIIADPANFTRWSK